MLCTVTCGEVRGWGGSASFKANFCECMNWSSKNLPLLAACLQIGLLLLSISYHNFYTHIGTEAILDLK